LQDKHHFETGLKWQPTNNKVTSGHKKTSKKKKNNIQNHNKISSNFKLKPHLLNLSYKATFNGVQNNSLITPKICYLCLKKYLNLTKPKLPQPRRVAVV
jgi:hypothetical protein